MTGIIIMLVLGLKQKALRYLLFNIMLTLDFSYMSFTMLSHVSSFNFFMAFIMKCCRTLLKAFSTSTGMIM